MMPDKECTCLNDPCLCDAHPETRGCADRPDPAIKDMKARLVLNSETAPDFGLGKGVLGECICRFSVRPARPASSALFAARLLEVEEEIIHEHVRVIWEEA